jgi:hypothetical protein
VAQLAQVAGTAQYYDRDTDPDLAQEGMKGFQEFMVKPERRDQILTRLEARRARIFGLASHISRDWWRGNAPSIPFLQGPSWDLPAGCSRPSSFCPDSGSLRW